VALVAELERKETEFSRLRRTKLTVDDFQPLTIIGRGAFGEVTSAALRLHSLRARARAENASRVVCPYAGAVGARARHGPHLCDEEAQEERDGSPGPGACLGRLGRARRRLCNNSWGDSALTAFLLFRWTTSKPSATCWLR